MRRTTLIVVVAVLALVAGACGGGKDDDKISSKKQTSTTSFDSSSTTDGGSTTLGASGTTVKGATATTVKKIAAPGTTAAASPADPNAVPQAATSGTYMYSQSGTTPDGPVPPEGQLVVSGGKYSRYYDKEKPPTDLNFDFSASGPLLKSAVVRANGATFTCTFGSPVPLPPWPPNPGRSFGGDATCVGPVSGITARLDGSITSRSGDLIGITSTLRIHNANNSI
ncbi:MAG: hypothetical protein QOF21_1036, partial [Actinomycetota bacterium]